MNVARAAWLRWGSAAGALASGLCSLPIVLTADSPILVRLLGGGILACSIAGVFAGRAGAGGHGAPAVPVAAPADPVARDVIAPGVSSEVLHAASAGTAHDMHTAMRLFGATIIDQVETSVTTVLRENDDMREMAAEMATASAQGRGHFKTAMARAVEAEGGIVELSGLGTELSEAIQAIATDVKQSITVVREATAQAATTRSCVETMATLSGSVSDVVKMIDIIARQTRMLALNATIEAARAGEAGRGFAVVAGEVKQLAHQTAEATQVIGQKIAEMTSMVTESVESLQALTGTIASVDAASTSIGRAVSEQEQIGERVSTSLQSMSSAVGTLAHEVREAAQIAANSGMLSDIVLENATSVDQLMHGLKEKLADIGAGMGSDAGGSLPAGDAMAAAQRRAS